MSLPLRLAAAGTTIMRRHYAHTTSSLGAQQQQQVMPFMQLLHILGGGSIGLLFAASIRSAFPSYPLCLLLREHHRSKIDQDTNQIMTCLLQQQQAGGGGGGLRPRMVPIPAQIIGDRQRRRPIENLVIATKAYAAADAVRSVLDRLLRDTSSSFSSSSSNEEEEEKKHSSIIVLCNGAFAVKDELEQLITTLHQEAEAEERINLILATTTHGAYQERRGNDDDDEIYRVVHAGQGQTFVEDHPSLSQLLDQSGLRCKSLSQIEMSVLLWQKLAANCAINPLTALYNCENGQLLPLQEQQHNNNLPSVEEIIQEVSLVAFKSSSSSSSAVYGAASLQQRLDYESLRSFVFQVIHDTHHNRSSMLQDIMNQQRTEVDYLNGYVVGMGKTLGIETPANTVLCHRIRELSNGFQQQ